MARLVAKVVEVAKLARLKVAEVANLAIPELVEVVDLAELELLVYFWLLLYPHVRP